MDVTVCNHKRRRSDDLDSHVPSSKKIKTTSLPLNSSLPRNNTSVKSRSMVVYSKDDQPLFTTSKQKMIRHDEKKAPISQKFSLEKDCKPASNKEIPITKSFCEKSDIFRQSTQLLSGDFKQDDLTFHAQKTVICDDKPLSFISFIRSKNDSSKKEFATNKASFIVKIIFCGKTYILKYPAHLSSKETLLPAIVQRHNMYLYQEIQAYQKINNEHPNIINFLYHYTDPAPALLLEYCQIDLCDYLLNQNYIYLPFILLLNITITDALNFIHNKGIIHGDIKPENILLSLGPNKKIIFKICDFGLCFFAPFDPKTTYNLQFCCGTEHYRAPEVERHNHSFYSNHSIDIYAFGITIRDILVDFFKNQEPTDKNTIQFKNHVEHAYSLAIKHNILERITAKDWNTYLKENALPLLSEQQKNDYGL